MDWPLQGSEECVTQWLHSDHGHLLSKTIAQAWLIPYLQQQTGSCTRQQIPRDAFVVKPWTSWNQSDHFLENEHLATEEPDEPLDVIVGLPRKDLNGADAETKAVLGKFVF